MEFHDYGMVVGNQCEHCEGTFIRARVLERLLDPGDILEGAGPVTTACPACPGSMAPIAVRVPEERLPFGVHTRPERQVGGLRCPDCRGYWFQFADLDRIPALSGGDSKGAGPSGDVLDSDGDAPDFVFVLPLLLARYCWNRSPAGTLIIVGLVALAAVFSAFD